MPTTRSSPSTRPSGSPPSCGPAGPTAELIVFEGESHGFRRAATIEAALEAELGFYRRLFAPDGDDGALTRPSTAAVGPPGAWLALVAWLRALSADDRDALLYGDVGACSPGSPPWPSASRSTASGAGWPSAPTPPAPCVMVVVAHLRRRRPRRPLRRGPGDLVNGPGGGPPAWWPSPSSCSVRRWCPLALEVTWATHGDASLHVQPEVLVVERAGIRAAHGHDPYQVVDRNGHILIRQSAVPVYELYYPYLPGMVVFGFSSGSKVEARLTDARIQFLLFTVVVALIALSRVRPPTDARTRSFQALTALPTAALPLATGGDDMPVVALMLLGLVALQRRRPVLAGLALGAASTLKFTAWPVVFLALFAATDRQRRRAVGRYAAGRGSPWWCPVVFPVALHNPSAFVDNVIRFPLGLAGVASPAASALPGHVLVAAFPAIHRPYVIVVAVVGLAVLARYLWRRPPRDAAGGGLGDRVGDAGGHPAGPGHPGGLPALPDQPVPVGLDVPPGRGPGRCPRTGPGRRRATADRAQLPSGVSNTSTEYGVDPVGVVGETTTPISQ